MVKGTIKSEGRDLRDVDSNICTERISEGDGDLR